MNLELLLNFDYENKEIIKDILEKVYIVGIGNELKGDDGAGVYIVKEFVKRGLTNFLDAGVALENHIFKIIEKPYKNVILIDAVDMAKEPGFISLLDVNALACGGISTHTISLKMAGELLSADGKRIHLIGIQPRDMSLDSGLSSDVKSVSDKLVSFWMSAF